MIAGLCGRRAKCAPQSSADIGANERKDKSEQSAVIA